jgi:hypothetical protein
LPLPPGTGGGFVELLGAGVDGEPDEEVDGGVDGGVDGAVDAGVDGAAAEEVALGRLECDVAGAAPAPCPLPPTDVLQAASTRTVAPAASAQA